jgi:HAD superfamily hydrolase (TIGR01509 family)
MKALVFDFDGLILDTESALFAATAVTFAEHGLDLDAGWWTTDILGTADHPHWTEILTERAGRPIDDLAAVEAARNERYHEALALEAIRPGVVELLEEAAEAGVVCAVASSSPRYWVAGHLERLGLDHHFAAVRTRDDVGPGRSKPAPDLYLAACAAVDVDPADAVALEDSPNGITAARAAGLAVVGVAAGMTAGLPLLADLVVAGLDELTLEGLRRLR